MAIRQVLVSEYSSSQQLVVNVEEMAQLGTLAVFLARPVAMTPVMLGQIERRDRGVLLLLDGRRTLQDVASLIHRSELEVAYVLVRLLKRGFVDFLGSQKQIRSNL